MITRDDLAWWHAKADAMRWTFAKTYADTAPHSYVVAGRTHGFTHDDCVRAARVIHTFGQPGKFYGATNIYLTSPDGRLKWWNMTNHFPGSTLINQATTDRLYGVQNAPSTHSGAETPYDGLASEWDEQHPVSDDDADRLRALVEPHLGKYPPAVLDVGCGTGRILDLGIATPERYAGVDPSTPMLNMLVRKHLTVAAVYPARIEDVIEEFTPGQFDLVFVDASPEMDPAIASTLRTVARHACLPSGSDRLNPRWQRATS